MPKFTSVGSWAGVFKRTLWGRPQDPDWLERFGLRGWLQSRVFVELERDLFVFLLRASHGKEHAEPPRALNRASLFLRGCALEHIGPSTFRNDRC